MEWKPETEMPLQLLPVLLAMIDAQVVADQVHRRHQRESPGRGVPERGRIPSGVCSCNIARALGPLYAQGCERMQRSSMLVTVFHAILSPFHPGAVLSSVGRPITSAAM
jgi:hypothetical protein